MKFMYFVIRHLYSIATRVIFFKVEVINGATIFGSLDNIVEDEEHPRSNTIREFSSATDSSVDTVFEKDPEVPESVLRIRSSTFAWGPDENKLTINALNFPRGRYNFKGKKISM